ncbi:MAG: dTDP-4-dehydrorhamnose reductase [Rhodobacteraceae bacterium]|nr:dTDP-4-dehydrorhamnose reductase [Paracoccaceae bacterium]
MKLLIFGTTGQVATELAEVSRHNRVEFAALSRAQADLANPAQCADLIAHTDADAIINAAAYTAVDRAESEPDLAHQINGTTPGIMARAAADRGLPFLHVSTDYVFDGSGDNARSTTDPVAPQNVYGQSKLAGEDAIRAVGGNHIILRTSWVFSAHGSNFVRTMLRLAESRDALSVVDDQIGGPTPARDIAETLLTLARAMTDGQQGGTYHYTGAPATSWAGFAREIFAAAGHKVVVTGIPTLDYPTPAVRPLNSRLDCSKLADDFGVCQPQWQAGLARVLQQLGAIA